MDQVPVWDESVREEQRRKRKGPCQGVRTDIQEDSAIQLLVDNMGLEDLVVERLWRSLGTGHCEMVRRGRTCVVARVAVSPVTSVRDVRQCEKRSLDA